MEPFFLQKKPVDPIYYYQANPLLLRYAILQARSMHLDSVAVPDQDFALA
jgi:hypothetical protein